MFRIFTPLGLALFVNWAGASPAHDSEKTPDFRYSAELRTDNPEDSGEIKAPDLFCAAASGGQLSIHPFTKSHQLIFNDYAHSRQYRYLRIPTPGCADAACPAAWKVQERELVKGEEAKDCGWWDVAEASNFDVNGNPSDVHLAVHPTKLALVDGHLAPEAQMVKAADSKLKGKCEFFSNSLKALKKIGKRTLLDKVVSSDEIAKAQKQGKSKYFWDTGVARGNSGAWNGVKSAVSQIPANVKSFFTELGGLKPWLKRYQHDVKYCGDRMKIIIDGVKADLKIPAKGKDAIITQLRSYASMVGDSSGCMHATDMLGLSIAWEGLRATFNNWGCLSAKDKSEMLTTFASSLPKLLLTRIPVVSGVAISGARMGAKLARGARVLGTINLAQDLESAASSASEAARDENFKHREVAIDQYISNHIAEKFKYQFDIDIGQYLVP